MVSRSTVIDFLLLVIIFGNVRVLVYGSKDEDRASALLQAVRELSLELDRLAGGMRLHPRYKR